MPSQTFCSPIVKRSFELRLTTLLIQFSRNKYEKVVTDWLESQRLNGEVKLGWSVGATQPTDEKVAQIGDGSASRYSYVRVDSINALGQRIRKT